MRARIFLPPRSAMQSGTAKTHRWVLEFEPGSKFREPLMGWTGTEDMLSTELRLSFETREAAIAFAEANGITYSVEISAPRVKPPKSYTDNFRADRKENWTH